MPRLLLVARRVRQGAKKPWLSASISIPRCLPNVVSQRFSSSGEWNKQLPRDIFQQLPKQGKGAWDELPAEWSTVDRAIQPHIRSCEPVAERRPKTVKNTGFHVYFLGTGGGNAERRLSSCTLVSVGKEGLLFDAGEAANRHMRYSTARLGKISRIFITHLHADHVLGLPGLLLGANLANLFEENTVLKVYGPPGLYNYIVSNLSLTYSKLRIQVEVYELVGGKVRAHWRWRRCLDALPQFRHDSVIRKTIPCGEDGVWVLKPYDEITRDSDTRSHANIRVLASEVYHVPNVQTFGFVVEEKEPTPRIVPHKARRLGVAPGNKFTELKNGFSVLNDDGTREVQPEEVLVGTPFKPRKLAILGDTCGVPLPMGRLCIGADVLIHEATLDEEDRPLSVRRGHSTASMAGQFADSVEAELLVLNHHKASIVEEDQSRAEEAKRVIHGGTRVLSANDFMELAIPRKGFNFLDHKSPVAASLQYAEAQRRSSDEEAPWWNTLRSQPTGSLLPPEDGAEDLEAPGTDHTLEDTQKGRSEEILDFPKNSAHAASSTNALQDAHEHLQEKDVRFPKKRKNDNIVARTKRLPLPEEKGSLTLEAGDSLKVAHKFMSEEIFDFPQKQAQTADTSDTVDKAQALTSEPSDPFQKVKAFLDATGETEEIAEDLEADNITDRLEAGKFMSEEIFNYNPEKA